RCSRDPPKRETPRSSAARAATARATSRVVHHPYPSFSKLQRVEKAASQRREVIHKPKLLIRWPRASLAVSRHRRHFTRGAKPQASCGTSVVGADHLQRRHHRFEHAGSRLLEGRVDHRAGRESMSAAAEALGQASDIHLAPRAEANLHATSRLL